MDLIEVLWKQDVDLGFTLTNAAATSTTAGTRTTANAGAEATTKPDSEDDLEKLKALLEIKNDKVQPRGDLLVGDPRAPCFVIVTFVQPSIHPSI